MYMHTTSVHVCVREWVCISRLCVYVNASVNKTSWKHLRMNIFSKCQVFFALEDNCVWPTVRRQADSRSSRLFWPGDDDDTHTYIHTYTHTLIYASAAEHAHVYMHVCVSVCMLICEMFVWLSARALCCYCCCCCCYCYCMLSFSSTPPPPPSTKNKNKASSQTKSRHQRH